MLWDDFDAGANGSAVAGPSGGTQPLVHQGNLAGYSQWVRGGGGAISSLSILFNNSAPKANSSLHARATFSSSSYWGLDLIVPYTQFTTGNELYFSFYYRLTRTGADRSRVRPRRGLRMRPLPTGRTSRRPSTIANPGDSACIARKAAFSTRASPWRGRTFPGSGSGSRLT